jgi:hypothetical protein
MTSIFSPGIPKRKRENDIEYPMKTRWSRSVVNSLSTDIQLPESLKVDFVRILYQGGLLIISNGIIYYFHNIFSPTKEEKRDSTRFSIEFMFELNPDITLFADCQRLENQSNIFPEIVIGTSAGNVQFWKPSIDFQNQSSHFTMLLTNREYIVDIIYESKPIYAI